MPERLEEIPEEYSRKMGNIFRLHWANQENGFYHFVINFPNSLHKSKEKWGNKPVCQSGTANFIGIF